MAVTAAKRSIWKRRAFRAATALNVTVSVALAVVLTVLVNGLAARFPVRKDFSRARYYSLSDKTLNLLRGLDQPIAVTALVETEHELFPDIRSLLREFAAASPMLDIRFVDPDRDLSEARSLARRYKLSDSNVLVLERSGRVAVIDARKMMDYDYWPLVEGRAKTKTAFRGEPLMASAIQGLLQTKLPVVGFTTGHGEGDLDQFSPSGYSRLGLLVRRDAIRPVKVSLEAGIPDECAAVVALGPVRPFSAAAVEALRGYLERGGRALFLLESGRRSGLEPLLESWGVKVGAGKVVGPALTGKELLVGNFGDHPATAQLRNLACAFYGPCPVESIPAAGTSDRLRVTALASGPADGWLETNPAQDPPRFDPAEDRAGAISLALAVERILPPGLKESLPAGRLVVIGDADFVANGALAGGNEDVFLGALNWLLERDHLAAASPRAPDEIRMDMNGSQRRFLFLAVAAGFPGAALLLTILVALARRR